MLQRLYVNNFRCLENFELVTKGIPSVLLIGQNGVGKSTVAAALEIFQQIGRGLNRIGKFINEKDFAFGRQDAPIRFEIEVLLDRVLYTYTIAFELPNNFREFRIFEENLSVDGIPLFVRKEAQVTLNRTDQNREAQFLVDWHLVALPVIQEQSPADPIHRFKTWLSQMVILAPIPALMTGESKGESLKPKRDGSNFAEWFSGLLSRYPAAYTIVDEFLENAIPDIKDIQNPLIGKDTKSLSVRFGERDTELRVDFEDLSDGEKCFFLCALVIAAAESYGPFFCFWDEPDSHLSIKEVGLFIADLRRSFKKNSQLVMTSHNPEAIRKFSDENTFVFLRKSHLEPTQVRLLGDSGVQGDLIDALIRGDVE